MSLGWSGSFEYIPEDCALTVLSHDDAVSSAERGPDLFSSVLLGAVEGIGALLLPKRDML